MNGMFGYFGYNEGNLVDVFFFDVVRIWDYDIVYCLIFDLCGNEILLGMFEKGEYRFLVGLGVELVMELGILVNYKNLCL